jgi:ankyrin repeat protein
MDNDVYLTLCDIVNKRENLEKYIKDNNIIITDYINVKNKNNNYLCEYVIKNNDIGTMKYLLEMGQNFGLINQENKLIICDIIKYNYIDMFNILVKYYDKNNDNKLFEYQDTKGRTILYYCVLYNNINIFSKIINYNNCNLNIIDVNGENI